MTKTSHEIRDPIHVFVRLNSDERKVLDSRPFQRLRHIHQLALSYLVYPGATHKRFEHSLGVMELADRIYSVTTSPDNVTDEIRELLPELREPAKVNYWRSVLRMACLCHDTGHLPFSHAAEKELLPAGTDHEALSRLIIESAEMQQIWDSMVPPLKPEHIVKIALGPGKAKGLDFSPWERVVADMLVGDAFGADRIDYLLRDSYHAGVAYGRFDHYRLIDTLRILPSVKSDPEDGAASEPSLGVDRGGLQSAESMALARHFMYSQVYFHEVRRIYDQHLKDFLECWLDGGKFSVDLEKHLAMTDNEVNAAMRQAAADPANKCHKFAQLIIGHSHYKKLYGRNPADLLITKEAGKILLHGLTSKFGKEHFKHDRYPGKKPELNYPVRQHGNNVVSALSLSDTLVQLPALSVDTIYVSREKFGEADAWLRKNHDELLKEGKTDEPSEKSSS